VSVFGLQFIIEKIKGVNKIVTDKGTSKGKARIQQSKNSGGLRKLIESKPYLPGIVVSLVVILDIYIITGRSVSTAEPEVFFPKDNKIINSLSKDNFSREFTAGEVELNTRIYQKSKGWEGDKSYYRISANILPPNLGAYYGINSVSGYINLTPHYYYEVWGDQDHPGVVRKTATSPDGKTLKTTPAFVKICRMWGVRDFCTVFSMPEPYVLKSDTLGVKHYELSDVFPRAWIVKDIISTPSDNKKSAELLVDENFNPLEKAIVNGDAPQLPSGSENGKAEIFDEKHQSFKIKTSSAGMVIISDTWYPKWKAKINGQDSKVYRVNNSMRGVISPSAGTEIEIYYDEGNIKSFLIVSLITLLGVCCYGTFDYLRNTGNKNVKNT
jgi:WD40 repeat protein